MLESLTGEASKGSENKNPRQNNKITDKYAHVKRFNHYHMIQFYMFSFIYVDTDTTAYEDYFTSTIFLVKNYNIISAPGPIPKHCHSFSYIFRNIISWILSLTK